MEETKQSTTVAVAGGFDPLHLGHIRYFKAAKELGDKLVAILSSDQALRMRKGYNFMPFEERKEVLESIKYIDEVILSIDEDYTFRKTLEQLKPDIFANGGNKTMENTPEREVCEKLGIKMVFKVGGEKIQSSSGLVSKIQKN